MEAIKTEVDGIFVEIDPEIADDFELFELICEIEDGSAEKVPKFGKMLFGDEQWKRIKREYREANGGKMPILQFAQFLTDVFSAIGEKAKN